MDLSSNNRRAMDSVSGLDDLDQALLDRYSREMEPSDPSGAHYPYHSRGRPHRGRSGRYVSNAEFDGSEDEYEPEGAVPARADFEPVQDDVDLVDPVEVPIKWQTSEFHFRVENSLDKLSKTDKPGIAINFGRIFGKQNAAKKVLDSGAYLGTVSAHLKLTQGPVSFAVRGVAEATAAAGPSLKIRDPNVHLAQVDGPVHAVLSKRAAGGIDVNLRDAHPVRQTWLSSYPGRTVADLKNGITATQDPAKVEVAIDHPVAGLLQSQGHIDERDMFNNHSVLIDTALVKEAQAAIEREETDNAKVGDVRNLSLVLMRAHGDGKNKSVSGVPAWTDDTEILDDYALDQRKASASVAQVRKRSPFIVEGKFVVEHGVPAVAAQFDPDAGLD